MILMDKKMAAAALDYLERTQIKGLEVDAYVIVRHALREIAEGRAHVVKAEPEAHASKAKE